MANEIAAHPVTLEDVVMTSALAQRPARPRDSEVEARALHSLAALLPYGQTAMLDALMDAAVRLCSAGTAGVSLLQCKDDGKEIFRWVALGGRLKDSVGGSTPREFSPCGTCLDRGEAQLYDRPGRYFTYLEPAGIVEGLVVPFRGAEDIVGTIWIVSHDAEVHFDREDVRMMTSLASFTATALRLNRASTEVERRLRDAREVRIRAEEFVGLLGHELRRPLQDIADGLGEARQQPEAVASRQLDGVQRQLRNLAGVVDGLLDISRVIRGAVSLHRQRILLETVITRAVEAMRPRLEARRHSLFLRVERGIVVDADPLRLEQVLGNLLDNAVRYTPPDGALRLVCETHGASVQISVSDTGVGIPSDSLGRIFEPFVQLPPQPGCDPGGTGLGLTLVRRLAELHGGRAWAESDGPGCGTTVTVALPCSRVALVDVSGS